MEEQFGNSSITGDPERKKIYIDFRHDISSQRTNETHEQWEIESSSLGNFHVTCMQKISGRKTCTLNRDVDFIDLGKLLGSSVAALVTHILNVTYFK